MSVKLIFEVPRLFIDKFVILFALNAIQTISSRIFEHQAVTSRLAFGLAQNLNVVLVQASQWVSLLPFLFRVLGQILTTFQNYQCIFTISIYCLISFFTNRKTQFLIFHLSSIVIDFSRTQAELIPWMGIQIGLTHLSPALIMGIFLHSDAEVLNRQILKLLFEQE